MGGVRSPLSGMARSVEEGGATVFYVYSRRIKSGREDFCGAYGYVEDAIKKIAGNYSVDSGLGILGEYYYFMKEH